MSVFDERRAPLPASDATVQRLHDLINGYWTTHTLHAAVALGLPDHLAEGPRTAPALAELCGAGPDVVARLLGALDALGVCMSTDDGGWLLTALGHGLRSDDPGGAADRAVTAECFATLWRRLPSIARHGLGPDGPDLFEHLGADPLLGAAFDRLQAAQTDRAARQLTAVYDASWAGTVVDVGGGTGTLLRLLLEAHPGSRGVLLDLPTVIDRARSSLAATAVGQRCTTVEGDFFREVPTGGDLYLLSFILHDWDDDHAVAILRACRRAMTPRARLVIFERLMPEHGAPDATLAYYDLHMMVINGGRERSVGDFRHLLARAGFDLGATTPTAGARYVLEARPGTSPEPW